MRVPVCSALGDAAATCGCNQIEQRGFVAVDEVPVHECFHVTDVDQIGSEVRQKQRAPGSQSIDKAGDEVKCDRIAQVVAERGVDKIEVPKDGFATKQRA